MNFLQFYSEYRSNRSGISVISYRGEGPPASIEKGLPHVTAKKSATKGLITTKTYGMDYLKAKLSKKYTRVRLRYEYYDMKEKMKKISALIPPEFQSLSYSLGWCARAVDSIADRLIYDGFDNDDFLIGQIYALNNADVLMDSSILSALISSCSFIYIDTKDDEYPRLECIDGGNATGIIDTATNMLTEGYAVLERDETGKAVQEAYFLPNKTEFYENGKLVETFEHDAPYPLLVPIIYRPDARRPFGHSRITRTCMDITQSAMRTLLRTEVGAEFFSVPQEYIGGLSQDGEVDNRKATLSTFLRFSKDDEGDKPVLGQFQQQSMAPHLEQLKSFASLFAGETGLTLDDLGFATSNPSSAEAIKAAHENLRLTASKAQRCFGVGFINTGFIGACIRDRIAYKRAEVYKTKVIWKPTFEPDMSALSIAGDGLIKLSQAIPDFITEKRVHRLTGIE